ncbi:MAG: type II secretion system inner membrane protein GspF [Deltaproteobacteria bacterium]|nr:type II secretion system inner membrane protein GspF [Deltaproteobacteria bacterium]
MPVYEYRGLSAEGKKVKGIIDAPTPRVARTKLRAMEIFPVDLREEIQRPRVAEEPLTRFFQRARPQDVALITRQLATLLEAGTPLVPSLDAIIEQTDNHALKKLIAQVREQIKEGRSFADALEKHRKVFSDLYVNMIRAGEESGALEGVLLRLADFTENQLRLRNRIRAALAYPIFMTVIGAGVMTFLLTFVIPTVTQVFQEMGRTLPLPTRILMATCNLIRGYWWGIIVGLILLIWGVRKYLQSPKGALRWDRIKLRLPLFGGIIMRGAVARFARTLGTLLQGGLPILNALEIVKTVVKNQLLAQAIEETKLEVREGESIAPPLKRSGLFPSIVTHMIATGEASGDLEGMLIKVADAYEAEVETKVSALTSILEPVIILAMGLVVGFIVISILLPIFEMNQLVR